MPTLRFKVLLLNELFNAVASLKKCNLEQYIACKLQLQRHHLMKVPHLSVAWVLTKLQSSGLAGGVHYEKRQRLRSI